MTTQVEQSSCDNTSFMQSTSNSSNIMTFFNPFKAISTHTKPTNNSSFIYNSSSSSHHNPQPRLLLPLLALLLFLSLLQLTSAHACLSIPRPRGTLNHSVIYPQQPLYRDALVDPRIYFPAGDRNITAGSGVQSQIARSPGGRWTPFIPSKPGFVWRAGVCGDHDKGRFANAHVLGGQYYYGGKIGHSYKAGSIVSFQASLVVQHNGFFQFRICDLARCGRQDIDKSCFRKRGVCRLLKRAWTKRCDRDGSKLCGPIDRRFPSRWYVPCFQRNDKTKTFMILGTQHSMRYKLPSKFTCKHCVLHFYYASADRCNPPGVLDYFQGPDRPRKWGKCRGGGGSIGGFNLKESCLNKGRFSEEYYNCADIEIRPPGGWKRNQGVAKMLKVEDN